MKNVFPLTKFLTFKRALCLTGTVLALGGCSGSGENSDPLGEMKQSVVENYATIAYAAYEDSWKAAQTLEQDLNAFVANPSQATFDKAKVTWRQSREPYGQTEVYRFYGGPIDNEQDGPELYINSWPLDEAYIDYTVSDADGGIINDANKDLSVASLRQYNLPAGENDDIIATGYHAIEFLLWGQDLNDHPGDAGLRPFTDFTNNGTAPNPERRRTYLKNIASILPLDLKQVVDEWTPGQATNYRGEFTKLASNEALRRIFVGVGSLAVGELSSQRMNVALLAGSQEDEHSCFSDNTNRDIVENFRGIRNVYFGSYTRTDGSKVEGNGLSDLFQQVDATLEGEMQAALTAADTAINAIDATAELGIPFDEQILDDDYKPQISAAIEALQNFGQKFSEMADKMNINIQVDEDGE